MHLFFQGKYSLLAAAWPCVPDDAYGPTGGEAAKVSALINDPVSPSSAGEGGGVPAPDDRNGDKNGTSLNRPVLTHGERRDGKWLRVEPQLAAGLNSSPPGE